MKHVRYCPCPEYSKGYNRLVMVQYGRTEKECENIDVDI
jgi:hypothetical protein